MTTPCKIKRTIKGEASIIKSKIEYIKNELEKRGLNPTIKIVIDDADLYTYSDYSKSYGKDSDGNTQNSSLWTLTGITPMDLIFKSEDERGANSLKKTEIADPSEIKAPYLSFKKFMEKSFKGGKNIIGGKDIQGKIRYNSSSVMIEITI